MQPAQIKPPQKRMSRRASAFWFGLLSACLLTQAGCAGLVAIPPLTNKPETGRAISPQDAKFIVPGQTTRTQVVARLGNDCHNAPRTSALSYSWEVPGGKTIWWWGVACPYGAAADAGVKQWDYWRAFFVAFDEHGVVTKTAFMHLSAKKSLDEQLEDWARLPVAASNLGNNSANSR
jgi:hypothetical protein